MLDVVALDDWSDAGHRWFDADTFPLGLTMAKRKPSHATEVNAGDRVVTAVQIKAWVAHLRSHGWTDKELGLIWLSRARQGVTR